MPRTFFLGYPGSLNDAGAARRVFMWEYLSHSFIRTTPLLRATRRVVDRLPVRRRWE